MKRMEDCGFKKSGNCYSLSEEFMDGDFTAEIMVRESGSVTGRVIDNMMGEEYIPLRMPNYTGAFVGSVRAAYEELLTDIADRCCSDVAFVSDQSNTRQIFRRTGFSLGRGRKEPLRSIQARKQQQMVRTRNEHRQTAS